MRFREWRDYVSCEDGRLSVAPSLSFSLGCFDVWVVRGQSEPFPISFVSGELADIFWMFGFDEQSALNARLKVCLSSYSDGLLNHFTTICMWLAGLR